MKPHPLSVQHEHHCRSGKSRTNHRFELALHNDTVRYGMNFLRFHNTQEALGRRSVSQRLAAN